MTTPPSVACADRPSRFARAAVAAVPRATTPLCVPSSLLLLASPRQLNENRNDDRESAAKQRASLRSWSRRLRGVRRPPVALRARCRSCRAACDDAPLRAQPAAAPCVTAPAQREPTRRARERRRTEGESSFVTTPPSVACADRPSRFARAAVAAVPRATTPLCVPSSLLLLASPRQLNENRNDDRESAAEPRASRRS